MYGYYDYDNVYDCRYYINYHDYDDDDYSITIGARQRWS